MHCVHPGSHPLSSSQLAGIASWLAGVSLSTGLAGVFSWLAGVSSWLAGASSWLVGVSCFQLPICVPLNAAPFVPYFPLPIRGAFQGLIRLFKGPYKALYRLL